MLWMLPWCLTKLFDIKLLLWEFPLYNCFYGNSRHVRSFVAIKVILATNLQYANMVWKQYLHVLQSYLTLNFSYGNSHYKIVAMATGVISMVSLRLFRSCTWTLACGPYTCYRIRPPQSLMARDVVLDRGGNSTNQFLFTISFLSLASTLQVDSLFSCVLFLTSWRHTKYKYVWFVCRMFSDWLKCNSLDINE